MSKRLFLPFVPGSILLVVGLTTAIAGPAARTQAYYSLQRGWFHHWPLEHGAALPRLVQPTFRPFTPVWVEVEPHVKMLLDPEDYVSRQILETGQWERDSWGVIQQHLQSGGTFVDIGAHIGYYSLKAAPIVGPSGRVLAIEPNPETVRKLRDNIQASGAGSITVAPVACADAEGTLELFGAPEANTGETSLSRANASQTGKAVTSYQVRARPLDDIVRDAGLSRVDTIKVDVEGAELLVLNGARETMARFHPMILVEMVDHQLRAMGTSSEELTAFLHSQGYTAQGKFGENVEFVAATR
ncbi:MAG TPA: FkbM family methyltransferase [Bryobacteraceae bacterium]|jgi:FkbM family methyltransferase